MLGRCQGIEAEATFRGNPFQKTADAWLSSRWPAHQLISLTTVTMLPLSSPLVSAARTHTHGRAFPPRNKRRACIHMKCRFGAFFFLLFFKRPGYGNLGAFFHSFLHLFCFLFLKKCGLEVAIFCSGMLADREED